MKSLCHEKSPAADLNRVLILIDTYNIGGPGKLLLQFLEYGGREFCLPTIAGFRRGAERPWQFRQAVEALDGDFAVLQQKFAFDPMPISSARRLAQLKKTQILESHGYKGHVIGFALKFLLNLPWIAYVHGWTDENLKINLYNRLERRLIRYADRIVPVSRNLGSRLNLDRKSVAKLVPIPNAIAPADVALSPNQARQQLGLAQDEHILLVVGRLSPEKGHRFLLEALPKVLARHPGLKLIIVGAGPERPALATLIQQKSLNNHVFFAGYQEDVTPYYRACDLLIIPSLSEGMPMAALEAMSCGRPVLATTVGGIPEVVTHGVSGLLVEPMQSSQLTVALLELLDNPDKMAEMGRTGQQHVLKEFHPQKRLQRIAQLYQDVLNERSPQPDSLN